MNSLIIQGVEALRFQFRANSGQEFRSLIESITLKRSALICSPYRIDLIYDSVENIQDRVLILWGKMVGMKRHEINKKSFLAGNDELSTLSNYFFALRMLSFSPYWFRLYRTQFFKVVGQEPDHPVHKKLIGCGNFLVTKKHYKMLKRFMRPNDTYLFPGMMNNREFARIANKLYLSN